MIKILFLTLSLMLMCGVSEGKELWKITGYCSCKKCCGKTDGITASGKPAQKGYVAGNWLPFGSVVEIEGYGKFKVMDRGAKSMFGTKENRIKHLDMWLPSHKEAVNFGVQYREVKVVK